jgi:hypothetical protein
MISTRCFAKAKASKYAAVILGLWAGFAFMGAANAVQTGMVRVTCTNGTFNVGWDNSNSYFQGRGNIAAFYCQIIHNSGYVSDNLTDSALRYYNGILPIPVSSGPSESDTTQSQPVGSDTATSTVETVTAPATSDTQTVVDTPSETQTPSSPAESHTVDSPNQSVETSTSESPSSTQPSQPDVPSSETSTLPSVNDSETVLVDTSTPLSDTATVPVDTSTAQLPISQPIPLPTPIPAVEPQPVPVVVEPQPEPLPQPDPVPVVVEEPISTEQEAPLEEPTEQEQVPEEQSPVEEPSEHPAQEETHETPIEDETQEQPELQPQPSPLPLPEPVPTSQPEIAYEPPTITLDNGVILSQEVAEQVELLQNPAELLTELFTNPAAAIAALGAVGADMSPEARQKSKDAVVQAVIVGSIVSQAAGAAIRRKP